MSHRYELIFQPQGPTPAFRASGAQEFEGYDTFGEFEWEGEEFAGARAGATPGAPTFDVDRAVRLNRFYGESLGWRKSAHLILPLLGMMPSFKPSEEDFAAAVARWQRAKGLPADGVLGPQTYARLTGKPRAGGAAASPGWVAALLPLLERHRGDIPLEFLLGWIKIESGGNIKTRTSLDERGYFQIHPKESKLLGLNHNLLDVDPEYSVQSGVKLIRHYMRRAQDKLKIKPGTDLFWRMVKFQHTGVGYVEVILNAMRRDGVSPSSWDAIRNYVRENTGKLRQHKFFARRDPNTLVENVDKLFAWGRKLTPRRQGGASQELEAEPAGAPDGEFELSLEAEPFQGYTEFDEMESPEMEDSPVWSGELPRRKFSSTSARRPPARPRRRPQRYLQRRPGPFYHPFAIPGTTLNISYAPQGADIPAEDYTDDRDTAPPPEAAGAGDAAGFDPSGGQPGFGEWEWYDPEAHETEFEWTDEVSRGGRDYVRWLQQSLNKILGLRLAVDGDAGTQTRSAVRSFQQRNGLKADGIVGAQTEAALVRAGASPPPASSSPSPAAKPPATPAPAAPPVISPLANTRAGLRTGPKRTLPVYGVCVHTTSGGPARRAQANPKRKKSALDYAMDFYLHGNEGFPHYVIDYDGTIYGTCSESQLAMHAGWGKNGIQKWGSWKAPAWWGNVWRAQLGPKATPASLLPPKARDPNSVYIGVELLADTTGYGFTVAQYRALARLVSDIARRHGLPINSAPGPRLLGHEDVDPVSRSNSHGGWDPGAP